MVVLELRFESGRPLMLTAERGRSRPASLRQHSTHCRHVQDGLIHRDVIPELLPPPIMVALGAGLAPFVRSSLLPPPDPP